MTMTKRRMIRGMALATGVLCVVLVAGCRTTSDDAAVQQSPLEQSTQSPNAAGAVVDQQRGDMAVDDQKRSSQAVERPVQPPRLERPIERRRDRPR